MKSKYHTSFKQMTLDELREIIKSTEHEPGASLIYVENGFKGQLKAIDVRPPAPKEIQDS